MMEAIQLKTRGELQAMRAAGRLLADALAAGRAAVAPGVSTRQVNDAIATVIAEGGGTSNFLNYGAQGDDPGFPATICASVNDEVVHGIPSTTRILADGDLFSIDAGCILDGWHADSAISVHVGEPADGDRGAEEVDLIAACERAMWVGISAARAHGRLGDISAAIEQSVAWSTRADGRRYGSVAGYGGHGIGTAMHMAPFVANQGKRGKGPRGRPGTRLLADKWTVVTKDGARAAHWEHSIGIGEDGVCVLTAADGGVAGLAPFGVTPISLD